MKYIVTYANQFQAEIPASSEVEAVRTASMWSYPWRRIGVIDPKKLKVEPKGKTT